MLRRNFVSAILAAPLICIARIEPSCAKPKRPARVIKVTLRSEFYRGYALASVEDFWDGPRPGDFVRVCGPYKISPKLGMDISAICQWDDVDGSYVITMSAWSRHRRFPPPEQLSPGSAKKHHRQPQVQK